MTEDSPSRRARDAKPASSTIDVVAPEELTAKPVSLALRYWNGLRGTRPYPAREEIVPRDMAPFLRNVVLARVIDGGRDYEYRIAGDAFVQAFGYNFKGMKLSQIEAEDPSYGQLTRALYEHVRNHAQPFALRGVVPPSVPSRFSRHETIFFPLGKDGAVDHLMATTFFVTRSTDLEETPATAVLPAAWREFTIAGTKEPA
jgi:hypothetical protein